MKIHKIWVISFLILASCGNSQGDFDWLVGSWERTNGKPGTQTFETWEKTGDEVYSSVSVVLKGRDTIYTEYCTIKKIGEDYFYIAEPTENSSPTKFKIIQFTNQSFKATNPNHDFPKEIKYSLSNNIIEASVSGNGRQIEYIFGESDSLTRVTPELKEVEKKYLEENIIQVSENKSDIKWGKAAAIFADKKILLLGEFNHGSEEVFILRNELIKLLHQNHNYNVILFESGIGEIGVIDLQKKDLAEEQMILGFFGGWRNAAHLDLMKYIKYNDIKVSGFDVQRTGNNINQLLSFNHTAKEDSLKILELESRYSDAAQILFNRNSIYDSINNQVATLIEDYKTIQSKYANIKNKPKAGLVLNRTLENRIEFLSYMLDFQKTKDWSARWKARDNTMAKNVEWLIENFYKNEKIILVGHNYHISKFNKNDDVMGEFLKPKFGDEMYSIGVFASKGTFSNNSGKTEALSPADPYRLDIKHVIEDIGGYANFLHIPDEKNKYNSWLHKDIIINDAFLDLSGSNTMTLANQFDGLLFIKSVSPTKK